MFWEVLNTGQIEIVKKIVAEPPVEGSYLAGGTGLALLLGHRMSIDFDWFSPMEFHPSIIEERLKSFGSLMVSLSKSGTLHALLNEVRVTWLYYPYPLLQPLVQVSELPGLTIASLLDIALMKWVAISQRGSKKDFVDLFFILQGDITLISLMAQLSHKFPDKNINYYHLVRSLSYFEDAERDFGLQWIRPMDWDSIKSFFVTEKNSLIDVLKSEPY